MPFDNICKRLAEFYPRDFAAWLLGEPVYDVEVEKTELSNEPIHADSLILLRLSSRFLHIEFQTTPRSRPPLPLRMLDYWVRWYRDYGVSVTQFVVLLEEHSRRDATRGNDERAYRVPPLGGRSGM